MNYFPFVLITVSLFFCFLSHFSGSIWFMPFLSTSGLSGVPLGLGGSFYSFLDSGWSEYYGSRGIYDFFVYLIYYYSNVFDHSFKFYLMIFSWLFYLLCL